MKNLFEKLIRYGSLGIFIGAMVIIVGCSSDGSSNGGGNSNTPSVTNNEFVGSWALSNSAGATEFYLYIESNNTFVLTDVPDKTRVHMSGTWSVTNGTFTGPFTNPGVGNGDLVGTIANGVMSVDFIEHWHSPDKHLSYTGKKLNAKLPVKR